MPAIFIGSEVLKANPDMMSVVIDLVRDHVKELFGGLKSDRRVSLEILIENSRGLCRKVKYEGNAEGLRDVDRIVRGLR